ncbi:MAG: hypothetical protein AB7F86_00640 [Bdellovibrionales bacterium]
MSQQKLLLWFTGILVLVFVFTFPTKDRRGTIDRIRMKVGAKELVSERTLEQIAKEEAAKRGKLKILRSTSENSEQALSEAILKTERALMLRTNVEQHCNKKFHRGACSQWLTSCGEACQLIVHKQTWTQLMGNSNVAKAKKTTTKRRSVAKRTNGKRTSDRRSMASTDARRTARR